MKIEDFLIKKIKKSLITSFLILFIGLLSVYSLKYYNSRKHAVGLIESLILSRVEIAILNNDYFQIQKNLEHVASSIKNTHKIESHVIVKINNIVVAGIYELSSLNEGLFVQEVVVSKKIDSQNTVSIFAKLNFNNLFISLMNDLILIMIFLVLMFINIKNALGLSVSKLSESLSEMVFWIENLASALSDNKKIEKEKIDSYFYEIRFLKKSFLIFFEKINLLYANLQEIGRQAGRYELARQVIHDVRSPMSALNMLSKTLKNMDYDQQGLLDNTIARINSIISLLYEDLKRDESCVSLFSSTDLFNVVLATLDEKRTQYSFKKIEIKTQYVENDCRIFLNKSDMEVVLSNLLDNAVQSYGEKDIVLDVRLIRKDQYLVLSLTDMGCGIPEDVLVMLGKVEVTHNKLNGSGLGLFNTFKKLKALGATIDFESKLHFGTTVRLSFPLVT